MDWWVFFVIAYIAVAVISFTPVLLAILRKVKLEQSEAPFEDSSMFDADQKKRLTEHYERLRGTLFFWSNQVVKYRRLHHYIIIWTIPSSILIPILTQFVNGNNGAKILLTVISLHTAILLGFHKGMKVEENFRAFRQGESAFYDIYRRLLDRPKAFGSSVEEQIDAYFREVERIRQSVRENELLASSVTEVAQNGSVQ